jgi:DNA integrity scanning protein DisA with diadenylate cyclase activity
MGNYMSLLQLTKVIDAVNELALKVQKLEVQVQSILNDKHNEKVTIVEDPIVNKKPTLKKSA